MTHKPPITRVGIGQDSHRFLSEKTTKPCIIGGLTFDGNPGFMANSDGDVIFHALCNAITSLTGILILGGLADDLCLKHGITDSRIFLEEGLKALKNQKIVHVALSLEGLRPKFKPKLEELKHSVSQALGIEVEQVGITATTGEGLSDYGCGDGVLCHAVLTTITWYY